MIRRLLTFSLVASVLAMFLPALSLRMSTVHAETHTCTAEYTMDGYYYSDGQQFSHEAGSMFASDLSDLPACVSIVQNGIIARAAAICGNQGGISVGDSGVGFMFTTWHVVWDGVDQNPDGPVEQQYDCGDISG